MSDTFSRSTRCLVSLDISWSLPICIAFVGHSQHRYMRLLGRRSELYLIPSLVIDTSTSSWNSLLFIDYFLCLEHTIA